MTLAVSWACDCRCKMCNIWEIYRKSPELRKDEMTPLETTTAISDSKVMDLREMISFTVVDGAE